MRASGRFGQMNDMRAYGSKRAFTNGAWVASVAEVKLSINAHSPFLN